MKKGRLLLALAMVVSVLSPMSNSTVQAKPNKEWKELDIGYKFENIRKMYNRDASDYYYITITKKGWGLLDDNHEHVLQPEWSYVGYDPKLDTMTMENRKTIDGMEQTVEQGMIVGNNVIKCQNDKLCSYYYQDDYIVQVTSSNTGENSWDNDPGFNLYDKNGKFVLNVLDVINVGDSWYDFYTNMNYPNYMTVTAQGGNVAKTIKLDENYDIVEEYANVMMPKETEGLAFNKNELKYYEFSEGGMVEFPLTEGYIPSSNMQGGKSFVVSATSSDLGRPVYIYDYQTGSYTETEVNSKYIGAPLINGAVNFESNDDYVVMNLAGEKQSIRDLLPEVENTFITCTDHQGVLDCRLHDDNGGVIANMYLSTKDLNSYKVYDEPYGHIENVNVSIVDDPDKITNEVIDWLNFGESSIDLGTDYLSVQNVYYSQNEKPIVYYADREKGITKYYELSEVDGSYVLQYITSKNYVPYRVGWNVLHKPSLAIFGKSGKFVDFSDPFYTDLYSPRTVAGAEILAIGSATVIGSEEKGYTPVAVYEIYDYDGNKLYTNIGKDYYLDLQEVSMSGYSKAISLPDKEAFKVYIQRETTDENGKIKYSYNQALMNEEFELVNDREYSGIYDIYDQYQLELYKARNLDGTLELINGKGEILVPAKYWDELSIEVVGDKVYYIAGKIQEKAGTNKDEYYLYAEDGTLLVNNFEGKIISVKGSIMNDTLVFESEKDKKGYVLYDLKNQKEITNAELLGGFTSKGLTSICHKNGKCGFMNTEGKEVIEAVYDKVLSFYEDKAFAKKGNQWYIIDDKNSAKEFNGGNGSKIIDVEDLDAQYVILTYQNGEKVVIHRGTLEETEITGAEITLEADDGEDSYVYVSPEVSTFSLLRNVTTPTWYVMPISKETPQTPYVEDSGETEEPDNPGDSGNTGGGSTGGSGGSGGGSGTVSKPSTINGEGIKVEGIFSNGKVSVGTVDPETVAYNTVKGNIKSNEEVIKELTLTVSNYTGAVNVTFEVGTEYNGKTVRVIRAVGSTLYETTAVVVDGKVTIEATNLTANNTIMIVRETGNSSSSGLDLSQYSNYQLDVFANSRVTSVKADKNGFSVFGYMWINNVAPSKNTWREIVFVNAEDATPAKAYRKNVNALYNTFLNSNPIATNNGKLDLSYANYGVTVNPSSMQTYDKKSTEAMAAGTYLVYMRISDGKNSYLFPLVDRVLSDGSTMESTGTLPAGFSVNDAKNRTLVYNVK